MVSCQAESAAHYSLESKQEVKFLSDVIYHFLPVKKAFVNLLKVLQIVLTLSVSTASCERSFSRLKRLKTYPKLSKVCHGTTKID